MTQIIQHHNRPIVCIQTFKTGEDGPLSLAKTLNEINPRYVILYHTNVAAVRQIEVYEARKKRPPVSRVKVFLITHAQTVEEQSYLTALRREKQAFEMIIDLKAVSGLEALDFAGELTIVLPVENGDSRVSGRQDR